MISRIKKYILKHKLFLNLIAQFYYTIFYLSLRYRVKGYNNKIIKAGDVILRKGYIKIKGNNNKIQIGEKCRLRNVTFEINGNNNLIKLSEKITFMEAGYFLIEGNNCVIDISESTFFKDCNLFAGESNTKIIIGKNCFLGIVTFSTSDFHSIIDNKSGLRINKPDNIKIGNNIWITNSVIVRKGAIISDDSVIVTNSLVNKKFLTPNVLIAGQPAKVIKTNINWSREKLPY